MSSGAGMQDSFQALRQQFQRQCFRSWKLLRSIGACSAPLLSLHLHTRTPVCGVCADRSSCTWSKQFLQYEQPESLVGEVNALDPECPLWLHFQCLLDLGLVAGSPLAHFEHMHFA